MISETPKLIAGENATAKYNHVGVKILSWPSSGANPKRAPLGALQNSEPKVVNLAGPRTAGNTLVLENEAPVKEDTQLPDLRCVPITGELSMSSQMLGAVEDIDADDGDYLILVSEYAKDIYNYLYELEDQQPIHANYLANQLEVTPKMRAVLIDWINEAHFELRLVFEAFHMAVAIVDLYLQVVKDTKRNYFQLVGVTALFIAVKYEQRITPPIYDFAYIMDDAHTVEEIRQMELRILKAIDSNLSRPLSIHFLRRYSKAANAITDHYTMSKYFLELASVDYILASCKPSKIAAASLFLSLHLINGNPEAATGFNSKLWTPTLVHYSRYKASNLRVVTRKIAKLARGASSAALRSAYRKYQTRAFNKIALRPELGSPLMDSIAGIS